MRLRGTLSAAAIGWVRHCWVHPADPSPATTELPAIDLIADNFLTRDKKLGKLELQAVNEAGEWRIEKQRLQWDVLDAFQSAAVQAGIPASADFNRGNNEGVGYFEVNQKSGWRWNTAKAFLRPTCYGRPNFEMWTNAQVSRLLLENLPDGRTRCAGVQVWNGHEMVTAHASQAVVLAAGAIGLASGSGLSFISNNLINQTGAISVAANVSGAASNLVFDTTTGSNASAVTTGNITFVTGSTSDVNLTVKSKGSALNPGTVGTSTVALPGVLTIDNTIGGTVTVANAVAGVGLTLNGAMYAGKGVILSGVSNGNNAIQTSAAVATTASAANAVLVKGLGADVVVDYKTQDFTEEVARITGGKGVEIVLDMVAGDYVARNLKCLGEEGRHVTIAVQGGLQATINMAEVMRRRLHLTGSTLRPRSDQFKALLAQEIAQLAWPLVAEGALRPVMDQQFPLAEAAAALRHQPARRHLAAVDGAQQIGGDHGAQVGRCGLDDALGGVGHTRVVDPDIDAAESSNGVIPERLHLRRRRVHAPPCAWPGWRGWSRCSV